MSYLKEKYFHMTNGRDEVVDVYANKDNALNVCKNSNLLWFCEYNIKY